MTESRPISRRTALLVGAGGAGAVALAACSGSSKARGSTGTGTRGSADLGPLAAVPVGQAKAVTLPGGEPGILARPTATTAACFRAICTHQGCTVNAQGNKLICPCHGSEFDALTGKVLRGPAASPLPAIPVTVTNGDVIAKS